MTSLHHLIVPNNKHTAHVNVVGLRISDFSRHLVKEIAAAAHLRTVHITSVRRMVEDQARIFYKKHILEAKAAKYKNPEVATIVARARNLHIKGQSEEVVKEYLMGLQGIEWVVLRDHSGGKACG